MLDKNLILAIKNQMQAEYLFEIPAADEMITWGSLNFRGVVAVSDRAEAMRMRLLNLDNILILGLRNQGVKFAAIQLFGKTIAILHASQIPNNYQIVMCHLAELLRSYQVVCVVIEDAQGVRPILETLLNSAEYDLEWRSGGELVIRISNAVSMETYFINYAGAENV